MPESFRFGRFEVRAAARRLLADGQPVALGARAFDLLLALIERRGRVVGKNELLELVWPGLVVEENNLQVQVSSLRKLLGPQAISTIPGRGYRFVATVDAGGDGAAIADTGAEAGGGPGNLPLKRAALIGREDDLAALLALLERHPLVTVVGPGGIGKTRLALAVGQALSESFAGGVWFVDLSTLDDPAQVAPAVARTLAVDAATDERLPATIAAALRAQPLLLVLDNCEHLLGGVAELVAAIGVLPQTRVLATAREPLKVDGEQVFRLAPLALPLPGEDVTARAPEEQPGAVQLFVARARAADRRFALTAGNASLVADICRRVDGLPLAIELAAARLPLLGLAPLRDRLDEQLRLLTSGPRTAPWRQQTLRATLDWSHALLSPGEQRVFRRLGVFVGGFSLPLVQQVVAGDGDDPWALLERLGQLVDKSLVAVEGDAPRYRLLESTRGYALEQLAQAGEEAQLRQRHARAIRDLLDAFDREVGREPRFDRLFAALEPEIDNIRAALAWAAGSEGERELALAIAAHSSWWWNELDVFSEGWLWCQRLRPIADGSIDPALQARFHLTCGALGRIMGVSPSQWVGDLREAMTGCRAAGDRIGLYRALCLLGGPTGGLVDHETVGRLLAEAASIEDPAWSPRMRMRRQGALEWWFDLGGRLVDASEAGHRNVQLAREAGGGAALIGALGNLADTEYALGHTERAVDLGGQAIAEARRLGRPASAAHAFGNIVPALIERGDLAAAEHAIREARAGFVRGLGSAVNMLVFVALLAQRRGDGALAARLIGAADRGHRDAGGAMHPPEARTRGRLLEELRRTLGGGQVATLLHAGEQWSEDEAFARAGLGRSDQ